MKNVLQSAMLVSMPYGIIGFFVPLQSAELGASPVQTGLLFSVFSLLAIILRPWVGRLSDRLGPRPVYIAALALFCAVQLTFILSTDYWGLLLARVIQALAASLFSVSLFAAVAGQAEAGRESAVMGEATGKLRFADMLGFAIGFYILGNGNSFRSMYTIFLLATLGALALAVTGFPRGKAREEVVVEKIGQPNIPFRVLVFGLGLATSLLAPVTILYVRDYIVSDVGAVALVFLPGALLGSMLPARTGKLADKYGSGLLVPGGLVLGGASVLLFPYADTASLFALVYGLTAVGNALAIPGLKAMAASQGGGLGASYGEYFFISGLAGVFGAVSGGWIYQHSALWVIFACSGILTIIMALFKIVWVPSVRIAPGLEAKV